MQKFENSPRKHNGKNHILTVEFYHSLKSFNEKLCIREAFHKHVHKNKVCVIETAVE